MKPLFIHILIFICCFVGLSLLGHTLVAQSTAIKFDRITTENGLPQEHVFAILEDKKGFLWLGMESGLARYDGYSFKTYTHDPEDSTSISSNIIRAIFEDEQGYLWIGTDGGGLSRYNPQNEKFTNFKHDPNNRNSLSGNRVYGIAADEYGGIWVATLTSGLNRIHFESTGDSNGKARAQFTHFRYRPGDPGSLADDNIWTMIIDSRNHLWAGTVSAGLDMLDLNKIETGQVEFQHFQHQPDNPHSLSSNSIKSIYEDQEGVLWVGTEFKGLNRFNEERQEFDFWQFDQTSPQSLSHNHVSCLLEDQNHNFWVGTNGGGVNLFDRKQGTFTTFKNLPADPYSLNGNLVNTIHQSRSGILWLGMVNKGLNWIDPQKQLIKHYYHIAGQPNSLNGNLIKAIYEDKRGDIWVGVHSGGLSHFDPETGLFTNYLQPVENDNIVKNNVQRVYEDSRGNLWVGTDGAGLFLFDRKSKSFTDFNSSSTGSTLSGKAIWTICEDLKGNLWIGTADGGLSRFDWATQQFQHFQYDPNDADGLNSNDIRVVFEDQLGIIWIGTYGGGLNRYNPTDETFTHYKTGQSKTASISNDIITDIFESPSSGQLWIGTFGGGLNRFDRATETFTVYQEKDGLANDVIKSIEEDSEGNLWVSTLKGISRFRPVSETFFNYSTNDGLQGNGFNLGASCLAQNGAMYFGGTNGMNLFFPEKIKRLAADSFSCLITDLKIFNRSIQPGEQIRGKVILEKVIDQTQSITIPYFIDDFSFEFAVLDFAGADDIKYAYQLEGGNGTWNYVDASRRYASFSNLSPGDYTFKVKASDNKGVWSGRETQLQVRILPAPWKTTWAYCLYALLLLLAIYLLRQYTIARFKWKNELKLERLERKKIKELNEMKLRFFTNISHEIRTPLTLILSPLQELVTSADVQKEVRDQLHDINRNANRLLLLVNQLLEFRKQEAGHEAMQVGRGDLVQFIMEIMLSFKEFALQRDIQLSFSPQAEVMHLWYDSGKMEKVFFNLLSNAFKFTPDGGKISIRLKEEATSIRVIVEDNGMGIDREDLPHIFDRFHKFDRDYSGSYLGSGIGLALVKKLVELHHGKVWAESESDIATRFIMDFPRGMEHFKADEIIPDYKDNEHADHYLVYRPEHQTSTTLNNSQIDLSDAPTLLLVEDNDEVRAYLKEMFQHQYRILEAADGEAGWEQAFKGSPDLIISDIMMPTLDGLQLCKRAKTTLETSHIPIILLTARTSMLYRVEGLETGADDYITKPFDVRLLRLRVKNLLQSRKKLREKFSQNVSIEPHEITITTPDQQLLQLAIEAIENNMDNASFDVNGLARAIGVSRPVLYRKLPAITDYTPNEFIRVIRLKRAAQILEKVDISITDVCHQTGFKTPKYFSKCFRDFFGVSPSEYARQKKGG
jgi:signal transduction histidine kinase/ligand-binding sensor domain-containing protein/DNA-binding response OmpR family regulator